MRFIWKWVYYDEAGYKYNLWISLWCRAQVFETLWPSHHGGYAIRICMRSLVLCLKTSFSSNEKYGKLELKNCCEQFLRSHEGARKKLWDFSLPDEGGRYRIYYKFFSLFFKHWDRLFYGVQKGDDAADTDLTPNFCWLLL